MHLVHVVMSRNHHNACVCVHGCGCTSVCVCECACVRASMCAQAFICIQRTCALQNVCIDVCVLCKRGKFMLSVSKVNFRSSVIHVSVRECLLKTLTWQFTDMYMYVYVCMCWEFTCRVVNCIQFPYLSWKFVIHRWDNFNEVLIHMSTWSVCAVEGEREGRREREREGGERFTAS